jgi:hypothetical protein
MQTLTELPNVDHLLGLAPHLDHTEAEALIDLVRRHDVAWEVWPERQVFSGETRQIGFSLELLGRHDHPRHVPYPGCDECVIAFAALRRIAKAVLPRGEHATRYEVQVYDRTMTYPQPKTGEGLVKLIVKLLHRSGYARPPDPCEIQCLEEIECRLAALGARPRHRAMGTF